MKLLANENIPIASVTYLKSAGFDIIAVGDENFGITDKEVMELAIKENRTIITYDSDYGELIFKYGYKPEAGVIYIRILPSDPLEAGKLTEQLITESKVDIERTLTVLDSNSIRQKKY